MRNALKTKLIASTILLSFSFVPLIANATDLNALVAAESKGDAAIKAEHLKQEALLFKQVKAEKAKQEAIARRHRATRIANEKAYRQRLLMTQKEKQKVIDHELAVKKQDNDYKQKLRDLQVQSLELDLKRKQVEVDRTNDIINANLQTSKAQTDLIQSTADSNRSISTGIKSNLESTGKAAVKKESGWFN